MLNARRKFSERKKIQLNNHTILYAMRVLRSPPTRFSTDGDAGARICKLSAAEIFAQSLKFRRPKDGVDFVSYSDAFTDALVESAWENLGSDVFASFGYSRLQCPRYERVEWINRNAPPKKARLLGRNGIGANANKPIMPGFFCQNPRDILLGEACPQHVRLRLVGGKADHTHKIVLAGIFGRVTVT